MVLERVQWYFRSMKIKIIPFLSRSASVRALRQWTPAFVCCGAIVLLAGCASEPDSHVVSAPPPASPERTMVTTTTTTTPGVVPGTPVVYAGGPGTMTVATTTPGV